MEVCGQVYSQLLYPQGKHPGNPLNRKLGEPQSQPGCFGEDKGVLFVLGIVPQFLNCPSVCLVIIEATLGHAAWVEETKNAKTVLVGRTKEVKVTLKWLLGK